MESLVDTMVVHWREQSALGAEFACNYWLELLGGWVREEWSVSREIGAIFGKRASQVTILLSLERRWRISSQCLHPGWLSGFLRRECVAKPSLVRTMGCKQSSKTRRNDPLWCLFHFQYDTIQGLWKRILQKRCLKNLAFLTKFCSREIEYLRSE